jgi:hypothetical protein
MYTRSPPEKYFLIHSQSCSVDVGISPHTPSNHGPYAPGRRASEKQMCNIFHFITKLTRRIHNKALIDDLAKKGNILISASIRLTTVIFFMLMEAACDCREL